MQDVENFKEKFVSKLVGTVGNIHIRAFWHRNYYEATRVVRTDDACSVEKSSTSYLQRLLCCPCAVQECLFILGSTDFGCSFVHEECLPAFAVGAALGGVGEESLPLDLLGFFNSGVTRSNTISNSATEAQEVSFQSLVVSGALVVLTLPEECGGESFD